MIWGLQRKRTGISRWIKDLKIKLRQERSPKRKRSITNLISRLEWSKKRVSYKIEEIRERKAQEQKTRRY